MSSRGLQTPIFDADNHLYEPRGALTEFPPDRVKSAIDHVDVRGGTRIAVRGVPRAERTAGWHRRRTP